MARTILKKEEFGSLMLEKIAELEAKSGIRLSLTQKILLAETGTVEQVLSILTGSAIKVNVIAQKEGNGTITRQSLITDDMGTVLIKAHSKVFVRNLPTKIVGQIRLRKSGIGTIIGRSGLETFRKIVQVGYCPSEKSLFRKYRIMVRNKIAFEIKEEFVGIVSGPGGI